VSRLLFAHFMLVRDHEASERWCDIRMNPQIINLVELCNDCRVLPVTECECVCTKNLLRVIFAQGSIRFRTRETWKM